MSLPEQFEPNERIAMDSNGVLMLSRRDILANLDEVAALHARLNTLAFALAEPTTPEEAADKLREADLLLLAVENHETVGFATYQIIPSDMGVVMYQARGLLPQARGLGFGRRFPQLAARHFNADYLMAKAQNPISIWSTISSGIFEQIYPIDGDFTDSLEMQCVLTDTIAARGKTGEVDLTTGLHPGSYPMGKLGDYPATSEHPGVRLVAERLAALGVDASSGDAVYYGGKIIKDLVS